MEGVAGALPASLTAGLFPAAVGVFKPFGPVFELISHPPDSLGK